MKATKAVAVAAFGAQMGFAMIAKATAQSKGLPTNVQDQAIQNAKEGIQQALKS